MNGTMKAGLSVGMLGVLFVYVNNTSNVSSATGGSPRVVAHRGVSQQYRYEGIEPGRCDAARMVPPDHEFIENTIPSMRAAFEAGASVVEFDVQQTGDGEWAVFHDRGLECRTNGRGRVRDHTLEQLQTLDVGYGYTADAGKTFPFRGKGVGAMPSMAEVFETFPEGGLLIDLKAGHPDDGAALAQALSRLPAVTLERLTVFGTPAALAVFGEHEDDVPSFSVSSVRRCLVTYILYGWTGLVPAACQNSPVYVPVNVAPYLWGSPNRFMSRMKDAGSSVVAVGRFGAGSISPGIDTTEDLDRLPSEFDGGIWTNDVGLVVGEINGR